MLRTQILVSLALGFTALVAGCAHEQESASAAAQTACQERHIAPGAPMDECIAETTEAIQRAREYQAPRPTASPP